MLVSLVSKMNTVSRFCYWIKERHRIYLAKQEGKKPPWTNDWILQTYFFTNPYRENDRTTVWFRENVRNPLADDPRVVPATIVFRWFNRPETGQLLLDSGLLHSWDHDKCLALLKGRASVFTQAFIISTRQYTGMPKLEAVLKSIEQVKGVQLPTKSMQAACSVLRNYPNIGGFMSYEIVSDLRHTHVLCNANDIMTWANPGPGCVRGLGRLEGITPKPMLNPSGNMGWKNSNPLPDANTLPKMQALIPVIKAKTELDFEMRDVEHSLCEFDKYERIRLNQGAMKKKYKGGVCSAC